MGIVLFLGLPGSGKSTLITELSGKERNRRLPTLFPVATQIEMDGNPITLMDTPGDFFALFNGRVFIQQSDLVVIVCSSKESLEKTIPNLIEKVNNTERQPPILLVLRDVPRESIKTDGLMEIMDWDVESLRLKLITLLSSPASEPVTPVHEPEPVNTVESEPVTPVDAPVQAPEPAPVHIPESVTHKEVEHIANQKLLHQFWTLIVTQFTSLARNITNNLNKDTVLLSMTVFMIICTVIYN